MKAGELMRGPITVAPTDSVAFAAGRMRDERVGCLVVSDAGRPVGIITDRDIALRCTAEGHAPRECHVSQHMSTSLILVRPDADVDAMLSLMLAHKVRRLPIVEHERLAGVVSFADIAAAVDVPVHALLRGIGADRLSGLPEQA